MGEKPKHLMISGLDDSDMHQMSAEERDEKYLHIREVSEASRAFAESEFEIVYTDSSEVYREIDLKDVDVRAERLTWIEQMAQANPQSLFVIVRDEAWGTWGTLLDDWSGRKLPNVVLQDSQWGNLIDDWSEKEPPNGVDESEPFSKYLSYAVHAWESLSNP